MVAAGIKQALGFTLTPGQAHDAPAGRELLKNLRLNLQVPLLMDRAYEGEENRLLAQALGFEPVVPPKQGRLNPWQYDSELYKRRNEIERLFGRIKRYRRIFTRYDKTDLMFTAFITITLIADQLR